MRHYPQAESPTPSSNTQSLHPALSSALASLDIQLEEELTRYRRLRGGRGPIARQGVRRSPSKSPDLISISATGGRTRPANNPLSSDASFAKGIADTRSADSVAAPPNTCEKTSPPYTNSSISTFAPNSDASDLAIAVPPSETPLSADGETGNAPLSSSHADERGMLVSSLNQRLDDYLESSEELLRSLAEEEAHVQAEHGFMQSLLTPLGVGSMLLLLISSAMFGYVVMNPSSLTRVFAPRNPNAANSADPTGANSQVASAPPQPNLADREFKDLNLGTLGTLKDDNSTSSKSSSSSDTAPNLPAKPPTASTRLGASGNSDSTPSSTNHQGKKSVATPTTAAPARTSPAVSAPPQYAPPASVTEPPQPARLSSPSHRSSPSTSAYRSPTTSTRIHQTSSSKPASTPTSPASSPAASSVYNYKVVTNYESDRSLEDAKKVVPDAYLRNFPDGARIQYGAYSNASEAEAKARELRNQGIAAEVLKP